MFSLFPGKENVFLAVELSVKLNFFAVGLSICKMGMIVVPPLWDGSRLNELYR